jgi:hypothetical protein
MLTVLYNVPYLGTYIQFCVQSIQSARLSVQSSELGPPTPSPASECCSPFLGPRRETNSLAGEEVEGPNPDEGTDTLVLYVYYNLSTHKSLKGSLYYASIIFFSFVLENEPNICKRIPDFSLCSLYTYHEGNTGRRITVMSSLNEISTNQSRGGHRHLQIGRMLDIDLISEPPPPSPPRYMYTKCGNLCGQRGRKRFTASWGLRMPHICPCTPCPSPQGCRS